MEASATPERFTLTAEADLHQLLEPLGEFIELDSLKLAGRAAASVVIHHAEGSVRCEAAQSTQVNLTCLTGRPLQEESVVATFTRGWPCQAWHATPHRAREHRGESRQ